MDVTQVLTWNSLTAAIDQIDTPSSFLFNMLYPRSVHEAKETRHVELSFINRERKIAPFVKRNGEALMVEGHEETFKLVEPPHIRIKRPMTPSELLTKRRAGTSVFPTKAAMQEAMRRYMAQEMSNLMDPVAETEEWMAAMGLRGSITYSSAGEDSWTIDFGRDASHDVDLGSGFYWDEVDFAGGDDSDPSRDFLAAAEIVNDSETLPVTDVILGTLAADAFMNHPRTREKLDVRRFLTGEVDFTRRFTEQGAMFLGTFAHGIRVWRYGRKTRLPDGTQVDLIRPKFAEFISRTPQSMFRVYYGAIEDMKAIGSGRVLVARRFSKSWEIEDPSARWILVESNPLPFPRKPNATLSMEVVS